MPPALAKSSEGLRASTPPLVRKSIILDGVHPTDLRTLDIQFACEQCSFFDPAANECLNEMDPTPHRLDNQLSLYNLTGKMAICRFLEID